MEGRGWPEERCGRCPTNIPALLFTSTGTGYVFVGCDGGVFNFGTRVKFYGLLPGENTRLNSILGIGGAAGNPRSGSL